jgi:hypothetical protein
VRPARLLLAVPAVAVGVTVVGSLAGVASPAAAAGCASMTLGVGGLQPSSLAIPYSGCVQFRNATALPATFSVSPDYRRSVAPGSTTPVAQAYVGRSAGSHRVTATSALSHATGTITVAASPSPSPSPKPSHSPAPSQSASPRPTPRPTGSHSPGGTGPKVAPSPSQPPGTSRGHGGHGGSQGRQTGGKQGPPATPAPPQEPTVPIPLQTPRVVATGPLESPSDRAVGLPAAVAGLLVVGGATALVRVLLAEPVDGADSVGAGA